MQHPISITISARAFFLSLLLQLLRAELQLQLPDTTPRCIELHCCLSYMHTSSPWSRNLNVTRRWLAMASRHGSRNAHLVILIPRTRCGQTVSSTRNDEFWIENFHNVAAWMARRRLVNFWSFAWIFQLSHRIWNIISGLVAVTAEPAVWTRQQSKKKVLSSCHEKSS